MRLVSTIAWASAVAWTSFAVAGCGNDGGASPGGGSGGSSGTGETSGTGGTGGTVDSGQPTDGAVIDAGYVGCLNRDAGAIACPTPAVTYADVAPIFRARCVSVCHNDSTPDPANNNMPIWGLQDYEHVSIWRDTVRSTMYDCLMPPPASGVRFTIEERRALIGFIACGLLE